MGRCLPLFLVSVALTGGCRGSGSDSSDAGQSGPDGSLSPQSVPSFTVATWNLHNFSEYGGDDYRLPNIAGQIEMLGADIVALQELDTNGDLGSPQAFDALVDELGDFTGVNNPWRTFDTSVGLVYNPQTTTLDSWEPLFQGDSAAFPRPPLRVSARISRDGREVAFDILVLHLKAFEDGLDRRRDACQKLVAYMQDHQDKNFLLLGDFNDDPHDPPALNTFSGTLLGNEPSYVFITEELPPESTTSTGYYHVVDGNRITGEFLDHAIATGELYSAFESVTPRIVSRPVSEYGSWVSNYSDHFPVTVEFRAQGQ